VLLEKLGWSDAKVDEYCLGYEGWVSWSFRDTK
jgi:hypothetical protein